MCKWSEAFSGNNRVCGLALQGGETVYIRDFLVDIKLCPLCCSDDEKINDP